MKNYFTINYWLLLMNDMFFTHIEKFMFNNTSLLLPVINKNNGNNINNDYHININNEGVNINNENVNINILQSLILSDENV